MKNAQALLKRPLSDAVLCCCLWLTGSFCCAGSLNDTCLQGGGGGDAGGSHGVDRDLSELEEEGSLWPHPPLDASPTLKAPLWPDEEISPIQVGISAGIEPPTTWKMAQITRC